MSHEPSPRLPDPNKWSGALFYAVSGGVITALLLDIAHHIHLIWS